MQIAIRKSISRKFMLAVLVTTFIALLLSGVALVLHDMQSFRVATANDLTSLANILAQVTTPALEFNDPKVAQENLEQHRTRPAIQAAAIFTSNGKPFANYSRDRKHATLPIPAPNAMGIRVTGDKITLLQPILRGSDRLGTVYLTAQFPVAERTQQFVIILAVVLSGSLVVAGLVAWWLQAAMIKPILALTKAVHRVIGERDFSLRVKKSTTDEIGLLVDAFNDMLAEVGTRAMALERSNAALQQAMRERLKADDALRLLNSTLEDRVTSRTTELELAHEQLRHSQKMEAIGQLTGGVAHDFNNVLQVITGNLQLLRIGAEANLQAQRRIETAAFAADRGAKLSAQLLAFARRQPLQPVPTNLGRVLRAMDELLRRALGEPIQINTVVGDLLWNTLVDPNQMENVILNLAINARDAMKLGGSLTLEVSNTLLDDQYIAGEQDVIGGQYVILAISDTGTGMPAHVMARVFEPFYTTKPEGEGTGLGLSMAYGFIKQSNGHIKIFSEPGSGTTVKIYLPRTAEKEIDIDSRTEEILVGGDERILVVEDDPAVRSTAVDLLTGLGYQVLQAADGARALSLLQSGTEVDMLFTDVVMPGPVRSTELARAACQLLPQIVVLFTSGYTQNAFLHGGRLDPGVELLSKPYRREDLARKVRAMLTGRSRIPPVQSLAKLAVNESELGSSVEIFVPPQLAQSSSIGSVTDAVASSATPSGRRILIVEDDGDTRNMLTEMLLMLGHEVCSAGTGEDALIMLKTTSFDLLLTDVSLPAMSGIDLARQAVTANQALAVIFSSGYGHVSCAELGFDAASLPKPYNFSSLRQVIDEALNPHSLTPIVRSGY